MLLSNEVNVKISKSIINYYKNKGYNVNLNDYCKIKICDLPKNSHVKISVKCDICGKEKELSYQSYNKNISNGGFYACSSKCAQNKVKQTSIKKFGTEYYSQTKEFNEKIKEISIQKFGVEHFTQNNNIKEKIKQTNIEKYGVSSALCDGEKREKIKQTWIDKYGVDNPSKSKEIKKKISKINTENSKKVQEKVRKTNLERYGIDYLFNSNEFQDKIKNIIIEKYGVDNVFKLKEVQDEIKKNRINNRLEKSKNFYKINYHLNVIDIDYDKRIYLIKCDKCHKIYEIEQSLLNSRLRTKTIVCLECNPINASKSGLEIELFNFIKENYNGKILRNKRKPLDNIYELDFYLPDLNLAFEFNGLWWHSEENKDKNYHKDKADIALKNKINLIFIWENDWIFKKDEIKNNILSVINNLDLNLDLKGEFNVECNSFEEYFLMKNGFKIKEKLQSKLCHKNGLSNKIFNIYNSGNIILYK